ncbi:MAG TPA: hypothetical protein VFT82_02245 [Candidatus Paceibacterota bacterium]|nr:hypothetical protein [Candidatus Paceibacterota bacterium]
MRKIFASTFLGLLAALAAYAMPSIASAGTEHNLTGYAWSSNIGWISLNCTNDNTCAASDYGVNRNADGTLTGYAWSSAIGWIQFGGLSGFPTGSGTSAVNAQMSGSNVIGWVKAIAADGQGWDGWISLSGTNYSVTLSSLSFAGYAWGGTNVGWISFSCSNDNSCGTSNYGVVLNGDATLDVQSGGSSIVNQSAVPYGTIPTFIWTLTNLPSGTSCTVSKTSTGGTSFTTVSGITTSGNTTGNALTNATYTYQIQCVNGANTLLTHQVSFTVAPQPPGFDIGSSDSVGIQVLNSGSADSQQKNVFVNTVGGFSNPVTISITGFPTPPASTTFSYSLNGGTTFSANPTPVTISSPYSAGAGFKMRVTRVSGAPAFTNNYTVTLSGTSSGYPTATKNIILVPSAFNPAFQEF